MIKSMTGFGRGEYSDGKRTASVEMKSVNHRYCEIYVKIPRRYSFAEEKLKSKIKNKIKRGKIDLNISIENLTEDDMSVELNLPTAKQYFSNLREMQKTFDVTGEITLELLSSFPDVMKTVPDVENEDEITVLLEKALDMAIADFDDMRIKEGEKLRKDLVKRGETIGDIVEDIETVAPLLSKIYAEKLMDRISDILDKSVEIPEDRLATEVAIFADKASITEEVVRLKSHIAQLHDIMKGANENNGKKLDFLIQEFNREANTIGSKANDLNITKSILEMKSEIEKIREQIQNIE